MAKRSQSELPPIRMVRKGMSLVPADAFSEEMLDGIRFNAPMDVTWTYEVVSPKRVKFWAVLNNVIKNCRTPWTNSKAAANALKTHLGVVDEGLSVAGGMIRYPMSLNDLTDPEFEDFYAGAMAILHKITGIDPESLRKASPRVQNEESVVSAPSVDKLAPAVRSEVERLAEERPFAPIEGERDPGWDTQEEPAPESNDLTPEPEAEPAPIAESKDLTPEPDEREMIPARSPVNAYTAEIVVDQLMGEATRTPATKEQREAGVQEKGDFWLREWPEASGFLGTCVHTCRRVAKGDLRPASARSYLVSIAPKAR